MCGMWAWPEKACRVYAISHTVAGWSAWLDMVKALAAR